MNDIIETRKYIRTLGLAEPKLQPEASLWLPRGKGPSEQKPLPLSYAAYIAQSNIISFEEEIDKEFKQYALDTQLFAQLAADYAAKRETLDWYRKYIQFLTATGWKIKLSKTVENKNIGNKMTMEKVILGILSAACVPGVTTVALVSATLAAVKSLSADDGRIKVFESTSHFAKESNFQVSTSYNVGGSIETALAIVCISTNVEFDYLLGIDFGKVKSSLKAKSQTMELNRHAYENLSDIVEEKLKNVRWLVSGIDIAIPPFGK